MEVETHHKLFSSEGGITLRDAPEDFQLPMFIAMDPPKHDAQRKVVQSNRCSRQSRPSRATIRERAGWILDSLPIGQTINWVDRVSIELTTQMLATLFDFPLDDRRKLTRWSDVATAVRDLGSWNPKRRAARSFWSARIISCGCGTRG